MNKIHRHLAVLASALILLPAVARANPAYGEPINLENAQAAITAAKAEALANGWAVAIAVVDAGGHLVAFERLDSTQHGSIEVALEKARTSAAFRRPSKAFEEILAGGGEGLRILGLRNATPIEGGLPLLVDGKVVGAIGVSGVTAAQDGQIAAAGAAALAP
jgi:glc operon protein GlcG